MLSHEVVDAPPAPRRTQLRVRGTHGSPESLLEKLIFFFLALEKTLCNTMVYFNMLLLQSYGSKRM